MRQREELLHCPALTDTSTVLYCTVPVLYNDKQGGHRTDHTNVINTGMSTLQLAPLVWQSYWQVRLTNIFMWCGVPVTHSIVLVMVVPKNKIMLRLKTLRLFCLLHCRDKPILYPPLGFFYTTMAVKQWNTNIFSPCGCCDVYSVVSANVQVSPNSQNK